MSLELAGVTVSYGPRRVLGPLSLEVPDGEWLGLVGPNGAGKSTLLKALAGLVEFSGRISLHGRADRLAPRALARLVAYVPQRPELPSAMTVADYVLLGRSPHIPLLRHERESDRRVAALVAMRLALGELADRRLDECSGGELQRVVLARALAQGAPLLLLDEPTTALDLGQSQRVLELVDELRRERELTVISAMHDLGLIGQFATRIELLAAGRIVAGGPVEEVLTPERIAEHYGATVRLVRDDAHGLLVVPLRRRSEPSVGAEGTAVADELHAVGQPAHAHDAVLDAERHARVTEGEIADADRAEEARR